jgi:hypothetical protein
VDEAGYPPAHEYADRVKAHGIEVRLLLGEVLYCEGANGGLLAGGDGFEWVSEAGPPAQLDFCENERVGIEVQIGFRALLTEGGAERLKLGRV